LQELAESFFRVVANRERKCSGFVGGGGERKEWYSVGEPRKDEY
jgi:hypothetical protein